ncbi:MAG: hypothetical protein CMF43_02190 [Legionellales bacterium]|nr:hypothetical protein [Legionellales bacterium]|tara:strand:- start:2308 stop:2838 length:531 start_codon:yes stop_codon:yes gene_type:complete
MKFSQHRKNSFIQAAKHLGIYLVNHTLWLCLNALESFCNLLLPSYPIAVVTTQVSVILIGLSCHISLVSGDSHWHWLTPSTLLPLLFGRVSGQTSDHWVLLQLTLCMSIILTVVVGLPFLLPFPKLAQNMLKIHRLWTGNCVAATLLKPTTAKFSTSSSPANDAPFPSSPTHVVRH